jgi:N-methylhydantoinase A
MVDAAARFVCGVDTGGTFTDCIAIDDHGNLWTAKASSTPPRFELGFFAGLSALAAKMGLTLNELLGRTEQLVHGTTVATNALLERRGATVGLIATQGHRDAIFVMRGVGRVAGLTPDQAMRTLETHKPDPLVSKRNALEVIERIDWRGDVVVELDERAARMTIEHLLEAGIEAIAVALIWAFRNPAHELRVAELIEELAPGMHVSLAHTIAPRQGEYERTAAAVIDAYVKPVTVSYLREVETGCREHGYESPLLVVQCDGNVAPVDVVLRAPVLTLQSGPAAGLEAARLMALTTDRADAIVLDMGGTSCDVGLIVEGSSLRRTTNVVSQYEYFTPSVEVESIGVGGGSIAWLDPTTGGIRVGPRSAGATPGPACYGRGGTEPTVTDADLVLGRIDPDAFLGGKMRLHLDMAQAAIARLAAELELDPPVVAAGISRLAEVQMAEEIRKLTVAKGYDPRGFALFAYGGAGPLHAAAVAHELDIAKVVVPMADVSSLWSAFGAATSDLGVTVDLSVNETEPFDPQRLTAALETLGDRARTTLEHAGVQNGAVFAYSAGMRFRAQVNEVWVAFDGVLKGATDIERLERRFEREYETLFGQGTGYRAAGIEIASFRCVAAIKRPVAFARSDGGAARTADAAELSRSVYWDAQAKYLPTRVVRSEGLGDAGADGPAIVELDNTTVVVQPGHHIGQDRFGNLVIARNDPAGIRAQATERPERVGVTTNGSL